MGVISFDPAARTGYAYRAATGWVTGVVDPTDAAALSAVITVAVEAGCSLAAVEDAYLGANPRTYARLVETQTRVRVACEAHGLAVELVPAAEWQSAWSISGPRADRKTAARLVAQRLGATVRYHDESDAVCLCEYAACRARQAELPLRRRGA